MTDAVTSMGDCTLKWRYFRPAGFKVKCIEFHPMQPWLAVADKGGNVSVWDVKTEQLIYETTVGTPDDMAMQDALLQRAAEKEPDYFGPLLSQTMNPPKVSVSGSVKDMKFCDDETAFWQMASQHAQLHHAYSGSCHPHLGKVGGLRGHRWLLMAIESKVVIHDMVSGMAREAVRTLWDGKAPTALGFLYASAARLLGFLAGDNANEVIMGPVLAVGHSAGGIALINLTTLQVYAKLTGAHKGAVTGMLPLGSKEPGGADRLVTAAADGTVAVWEPSLATTTNQHAPVATWKAHDGPVSSLTFYRHLTDSPEQPPLRLATAGEEKDKRVCFWDTDKWKTAGSSRPLPKGSVAKVMFTGHGAAAFGDEPCLLLASEERPALWGLHPGSGSVYQLIAMEHLIPPGQKKVPKVYTAACHPLLPHLVAVAANSGVAFLSFDVYDTPPVHCLPLGREEGGDLFDDEGNPARGDGTLDELEAVLAPEAAAASAASLAEAKANGLVPGEQPQRGVTLLGGLVDRKSKGQAFLIVVGKALWAVFYRTSSREGYGGEGGPRQLTAELASREIVARLPHAGKPQLGCSASGRCVSVVWPHAREYTIFIAGEAGTWDKLTEGVGTHLVWAATSSTFAVLHAPSAAVPDFGRGSRKKSKQREEELARAAAVAEAQRRAAAAACVQIFEVDEAAKAVQQVSERVDTRGGFPARLHGGALLGITFTASHTSGSRTGQALQFFSWKGGQRAIGPPLVEPRWLAWDPDVTLCALAYEDAVVLAAVRPDFRAFASLPVQHAVSGVWRRHQLFLLTPDSLVLAFAAAGGGGGRMVGLGGTNEPFLEVVPLASLQGAVAEAGDTGAALPAEGMRPGGAAVVLGPRNGNLWLADALGQPFLVPLTQPGLRARTKAARNNLAAARAAAEKGLLREHHDEVGRFFAALQPEGAAAAALLPGLSLHAELSLAIQRGQFKQALQCLEALAAGHSERAALSALPDLPERAADPAADPKLAELVGMQLGLPGPAAPELLAARLPTLPPARRPNFAGMQQADDQSDSDDSEMSAESAGGTIDWDIPMKLPRSVLLAARQARAAQDAATNSTYGTAAAAIAAVADQALQLASAANEAGATEVARGALRIVAAGGAGLATEQVVRVLLEMARAGMAREADALAALLSAPGVRKAPQVVALAAAIAQDPATVQQTLQSSGLVALAALFTHSWRAGNALSAIQEWTAQLQNSSADPDKITILAPRTI